MSKKRNDNVVEIAARLRDGREVRTDEDTKQWIYEYLDNFSNEIGLEWTPIDVFPAWVRVMTEWVDVLSDCGCEQDNAQALAAAIAELTKCLQRVLAPPPEDDKNQKPKITASEVLEDMFEDELFELNEMFKLGVNLHLHKTSLHKRQAIVVALRSAGMLLED
jgi:hypothetical protein